MTHPRVIKRSTTTTTRVSQSNTLQCVKRLTQSSLEENYVREFFFREKYFFESIEIKNEVRTLVPPAVHRHHNDVIGVSGVPRRARIRTRLFDPRKHHRRLDHGVPEDLLGGCGPVPILGRSGRPLSRCLGSCRTRSKIQVRKIRE